MSLDNICCTVRHFAITWLLKLRIHHSLASAKRLTPLIQNWVFVVKAVPTCLPLNMHGRDVLLAWICFHAAMRTDDTQMNRISNWLDERLMIFLYYNFCIQKKGSLKSAVTNWSVRNGKIYQWKIFEPSSLSMKRNKNRIRKSDENLSMF